MTDDRFDIDDDTNEAYEKAGSAASRVPGLLERLADRMGANAGASAVFGEPVKEGDRTVIPVAQAIIGTGAGGGGDLSASDSGLGAGAGALTKPIGYIEVTPAGAEFVPLTPPWRDARIVLAYTLLALVISRTLVKLVRG